MEEYKTRSKWLWLILPIPMLILYLLAEGGWAFYSARYEPDPCEPIGMIGGVVFTPGNAIDRCIDRDPKRYYSIPVLRPMLVAREKFLTWCAVQSGAPRCGCKNRPNELTRSTQATFPQSLKE